MFSACFIHRFVCDNCLKKKGLKRKENKFNAKRLPVTKLGAYIEARVNNFLKKKEAGAGEVAIRVVASSDKIVEVKPGMRNRFVEPGDLPDQFPYRAKALFAFEEVDGTDVCFFGMHVQEYGSECPCPNTRRVYIAYLDSVHFFRPRQFRTAVYHEILLGYLDYVKQLGYTMAHIWACPPSEGDDYIFHCHPAEQKIPKPKRLQEWYKKMLDKGIIERIVLDYKDILKQAVEDKLSSAAELPYFEGDFWPNVLEESIKELDQEEEEKRKQAEAAEAAAAAAANIFSMQEESEAGPDGKKKGQKKAKKSNKSKANQRKNSKKSNTPQTGNDLSAKIFATMEKHKEVFFVIRLHSAQSAASLADFDLCVQCFEKEGHQHKMEKLGLDLDDGSSPSDQKQANPQEARKLSIQRCIQSLVHACQCRDANCRLPSCQKMKRVVQHTKICKRKTNGGCPICKQLIALCCYHAKHCQETKCPVPFCLNIKHKLKQQQLQQRLQQAQLLRRRMAVMNTRSTVPSGALPGNSSAVGPGGVLAGGAVGQAGVMSGQPGAGNMVQEEAARQQAPHYPGKVTPIGVIGGQPQVMPPPQMQRPPIGAIGPSNIHAIPAIDQWRYVPNATLQNSGLRQTAPQTIQQQQPQPPQPHLQQPQQNMLTGSHISGPIPPIIRPPPTSGAGGISVQQQQQLMQAVRSPPPIRSPQPNPSPRPVPSPRNQPVPSPRGGAGPVPSPHHHPPPPHVTPTHSPAHHPSDLGGSSEMMLSQLSGGAAGQQHGAGTGMPHHPSPAGAPPGSAGSSGQGPTAGGSDPNEVPPMTPQDKLTKFVEQL
ncbi:hypothetical protein C0J52_12712 [Blattella germanica]|nr:hypothetical protein C0J52_12712 [Blattella germanica]